MSGEEENGSGGEARRVHLVLSSGGVKCVSYVGAVAALAEHGYALASVSACSAGSVLGALLCAGVTPEELREAIYALDFKTLGINPKWPRLWPQALNAAVHFRGWPLAWYEKSNVPEVFRAVARTDPTFGQLQTPFSTFSVDLRTQRMHVYSTRGTPRMRVTDAVRIATAVPFMFPPHEDGDRLLVDGALVSQSPVWLATMHDDELPILVLRPRKDRNYDASSLTALAYMISLIDLGGGSRDEYLIDQIPRARLLEIDCTEVAYDQFDLTTEQKKGLVASGRAAVETSLRDLENLARGVPDPPAPPALRRADDDDDDDPELSGRRAMSRAFAAVPSPPKREQVFISYSHRDKEWLHTFQDALKPYIRSRAVTLWDDTQIQGGARWQDEIKRAMAAAKVAVLLVTRNYLASDFVWEVELKEFLRASEADGLKVLPVIVGASAYADTHLGAIQAVNSLDIPLKELDEAALDEELVRICREIKEALES